MFQRRERSTEEKRNGRENGREEKEKREKEKKERKEKKRERKIDMKRGWESELGGSYLQCQNLCFSHLNKK